MLVKGFLMATPQERRNIRLKNDYTEMVNIKGKIIDWRIIQGIAPYIEEYELTVNVRAIIGPKPEYRNRHILRVTLSPNYPFSAPLTVMSTTPSPYHPNWYRDGRWCYGGWDIAEGLGHHVVRMMRTLQFDEDITNPNSPANGEASMWYQANRNRGWFPCDQTVLPDPTKARFVMDQKPKKTFRLGS
jgi:ubiquitin-protein ligase